MSTGRTCRGRIIPPLTSPASSPSSCRLRAGEPRRARLRRLGDAPTRHPEWLIKYLIPKVGVGLLSGQSRIGKSFLAIDLAGAVAQGGHFFGKLVKEKVGVLLLVGEGASTMEPRVEACRRFKLGGCGALSLPIVWAEATGHETWPQLVQEAKRDLWEGNGVRLGLIIFDTLAAVFNVEDENRLPSSDGHDAKAEPSGCCGRPAGHRGQPLWQEARGGGARIERLDG